MPDPWNETGLYLCKTHPGILMTNVSLSDTKIHLDRYWSINKTQPGAKTHLYEWAHWALMCDPLILLSKHGIDSLSTSPIKHIQQRMMPNQPEISTWLILQGHTHTMTTRGYCERSLEYIYDHIRYTKIKIILLGIIFNLYYKPEMKCYTVNSWCEHIKFSILLVPMFRNY